jgi:hypothetical protein
VRANAVGLGFVVDIAAKHRHALPKSFFSRLISAAKLDAGPNEIGNGNGSSLASEVNLQFTAYSIRQMATA